MKRKCAFLLALLMVVSGFNLYPFVTSALSESALGDLIYYNAIIRDNFKADQADVEGSLAVGGDLIAPALSGHSYSIGAAYAGASGQHIGQIFDDTNGPALLIGGSYTNLGEGLHVLGDYTTFPGNPSSGMQVSGNRHEISKQDILDQIDAMIERADIYLNRALAYEIGSDSEIDGGAGYNSSQMGFYLSKEDYSVNIGIISGTSTSDIGEIYLPSNIVNQNVTIIVSNAETINFLPGGTLIYNGSQIDANQLYQPDSTMTKIASRIIYFFPNAKEVFVEQQAVIGSVFAPQAHLNAVGGAINGQSVFKSAYVSGGFEFHNFSFSWRRELATGELKLLKMNRETNEPLSAAEFSIFTLDSNQLLETQITDENGEVFFHNIPYGQYVLRETASPPGFISDFEDTVFEIHAQQQVVVLRAYNTPGANEEGSLQVIKEDSHTRERLAGAKFELRSYDDALFLSGATNSEGILQFDNVPIGMYRLIEIEAPAGYRLEPNNEHIIRVDAFKTYVIMVSNQKESLGEFIIRKINVLGEPLEGAVFTIWDSENTEVTQETTNELGIIWIKDLPLGEYSYQETQAPDGYDIDDTVRNFVLNREFQVLERVLINYIEDEEPGIAHDGSIKLHKIDSQDTSVRLANAEFLLTHLETQNTYTLITDENGEAALDELPYGQYQLQEINPPPGYVADGDYIHFTIDEHAKEHEYTFRNEKIVLRLGSIFIHKYDRDTYDTLGEAKFKLTNTETGETQYATTDIKGDARFSNLEFGFYELKELEAPEGYERETDMIQINIAPIERQFLVPFPNTKIATHEKILTILKVDQYDRSLPLSGAQFRLEDEFGEFLARGTTDELGTLVFSNLPSEIEKVYLIEEIAPNGYELAAEPMEIKLDTPGINSYYQSIVNRKRSGKLMIQKKLSSLIYGEEYDFTQIQFQLFGSTQQVVIRLDENGQAEWDLPPGFYSIRESSVPENMLLNIDLYRFEIRSDEISYCNITNHTIDTPITVWLRKTDDEGTCLNGIPFELFIKELEGEVQSKGIVLTQNHEEEEAYSGDGIAVWNDLSMSKLFNENGEAQFKEIYALERERNKSYRLFKTLLQNII